MLLKVVDNLWEGSTADIFKVEGVVFLRYDFSDCEDELFFLEGVLGGRIGSVFQ